MAHPHTDDQGRPEPPLVAGEADTLLGFLEFQRATLEWKTRGLDDFKVESTPTFFINGNKYAGALSVDEMSAIIDSML